MDYGAGKSASDALDRLDPGDDELAEIVDIRSAGSNDDVIWPGDIFGRVDAFDIANLFGDLGGLADLGLNQDISLHVCHACPPC
jgi:hypothetical protein